MGIAALNTILRFWAVGTCDQSAAALRPL